MATLTEVTPSQVLAAYNIMPLRAKSAYVRLIDELEEKKKLPAVVQPVVAEEEEEEDHDKSYVDAIETQKPIIKKPKFLSQSFSVLKPSQIEQSNNFFLPKKEDTFFLDRFNINKDFDFKAASENLANKERLVELERTNLNLRRMIQLMSADPTRSEPGTLKLLPNRTVNKTSVPKIRQGRIGSSWRHIKQTNNYSGNNLLFIDGTVSIDDSLKYPPRQFGYPPKIRDIDQKILGLTTQSLSDLSLPIQHHIRNRSANLKSNENSFHEHAKSGFEYWLKDRRIPENNKPKAKPIGIGQPFFKSGF